MNYIQVLFCDMLIFIKMSSGLYLLNAYSQITIVQNNVAQLKDSTIDSNSDLQNQLDLRHQKIIHMYY